MGRRHARASRGRDTVDCGAPSRPRRFPAGARRNGPARPRANDRATARRLTMRCCSEPRVCFARRGKPPAMKEELRLDGPEPAVVEEDREVRQQRAARPELEIVRREHTRDRRERGGAANAEGPRKVRPAAAARPFELPSVGEEGRTGVCARVLARGSRTAAKKATLQVELRKSTSSFCHRAGACGNMSGRRQPPSRHTSGPTTHAGAPGRSRTPWRASTVSARAQRRRQDRR